MATPDWQSPDGTIRLYCGDCQEILPQLQPEFAARDTMFDAPREKQKELV